MIKQILLIITLMMISSIAFTAQPYKVKKSHLKLKQSPRIIVKNITHSLPIYSQVEETVIHQKRISHIDVIKSKKKKILKHKRVFKKKILKHTNPEELNTKGKYLLTHNKLNKNTNDPQPEYHLASITGLVFAILTVLTGGLTSPFAIIFNSIAFKKIKKSPKNYKGKDLAMVGLVIGIVGLLLLTTLLIIFSL